MIKRSTCSLLFVALCIFISSHAQTWWKTDLGIKTEVNSTALEVQFYSPFIARIIKTPAGHNFSKESLPVIKKPQQTTFISRQQGDVLNLKTSKLACSQAERSTLLLLVTEKALVRM